MSPRDSMDDASLLRLTAEGDRAAFGRLVVRHQASVYRLARSIAPDEARAEEALQEAFIAALRGAGTFRGEGSVRSWLLTLARHATYRLGRSRAGEPQRFEPLTALGAAAGWGQDEPADEQIDRKERAARLRRALASLSNADREILVLRELEELSGEETARVLDLSLAAMKSRLHRARLRLAVALKEDRADA